MGGFGKWFQATTLLPLPPIDLFFYCFNSLFSLRLPIEKTDKNNTLKIENSVLGLCFSH